MRMTTAPRCLSMAVTSAAILAGCWTVEPVPAARASAQRPEPRQRGVAKAAVTRPARFPHRIWAACDFEGRTPDYA